MSPTLILYSLFYLAVFIVVCAVLTTCIKQVIHQWYAAKYAYVLGTADHADKREKQLV